MRTNFSRRDFLKLSGLGLGALAFRPKLQAVSSRHWTPEFPNAERLGRVTVGIDEEAVRVRSAPSTDASEVGRLPGDTVVEWLREVVGYTPYRSQRWVETPQGFVWAPFLQPVKNIPNTPMNAIPTYGDIPGMWMEVTVPYVEAQLANPPAKGHRIQFLTSNSYPVHFYYGQTFWVDEIRSSDLGAEYHVRELHGSRGDEFWAPAAAFKPVNPEEITPITPEIENKEIVINIARQTLSCFEDGREVFFTRVSTGDNNWSDKNGNGVQDEGEERATPVSDYLQVYMKYDSVHMEGGTTGAGYDLSGIGWTTFIATGGIAIHSTYWHNNFGERTSAGCVNVTPEDAKFIFRWSSPEVPYYPGKMELIPGTKVRTVEI
jgi:lipoprotein-anchoring transpeptidase ErfK/SrfK